MRFVTLTETKPERLNGRGMFKPTLSALSGFAPLSARVRRFYFADSVAALPGCNSPQQRLLMSGTPPN